MSYINNDREHILTACSHYFGIYLNDAATLIGPIVVYGRGWGYGIDMITYEGPEIVQQLVGEKIEKSYKPLNISEIRKLNENFS